MPTCLPILLCLALAPAGPNTARTAQDPPAFGQIPGIQVEGPPPAWIRPGLRLTYKRTSSYVPSSNVEMIEGITRGMKALCSDSVTGRKYSSEELWGSGSAGFLQANVLALDAERAVIQMTFHLFDGLDSSAPVEKLESGYVAPASMGGDLWIHPEALEKLAGSGSEGRSGQAASSADITRTEYKLGQATYKVVQIVRSSDPRLNPGAPRSFGIWIYDLASGILLHSGSVTGIAANKTPEGATLAPSAVTIQHTIFEGSRRMNLPWSSQPPPSWLGGVKRFRFGGKFSLLQQGVPTSPQLFDVNFDVSARGPGWLQLEVGGGSPQSGEEGRVAGSLQLGGLWIPPGAMASLKAGQLLDQDPFTKVTTSVSSVSAQAVVLTLAGPRQQKELHYDPKSGLISRAVVTERILGVPGMSNRVELQLNGTD